MNMQAVKVAPDGAFHVQTVQWVRHWNDRLFSFAVDRPGTLRFRSGEFIMLGLPAEGGRPLLRAYSIASPHYADELEFLSIKVDDGPLTSRLQKIVAGDAVWFARKTTGTLVTDALTPGGRLILLATGTGLAPFLSLIRDPDVYERYEQIVVVHGVRQLSDLAYFDELQARLTDDPLIAEEALQKLRYVPTVTRDPFVRMKRITTMMEDGSLFDGVDGPARLSPKTDRVMMCGSMDMIRDCAAILESMGFEEGSNARPADFVIERAFVG